MKRDHHRKTWEIWPHIIAIYLLGFRQPWQKRSESREQGDMRLEILHIWGERWATFVALRDDRLGLLRTQLAEESALAWPQAVPCLLLAKNTSIWHDPSGTTCVWRSCTRRRNQIDDQTKSFLRNSAPDWEAPTVIGINKGGLDPELSLSNR